MLFSSVVAVNMMELEAHLLLFFVQEQMMPYGLWYCHAGVNPHNPYSSNFFLFIYFKRTHFLRFYTF